MECINCHHLVPSTPVMNGLNADQPKAAPIPILQCQDCGLIQSDLGSIKASFDDLYFDSYYGEKQDEKFGLLIRFFQAERQRIALKGLQPGLLLDVGCGDGTFLKNLPKVWQRYGYEPSKPGQASLKSAGLTMIDMYEPPPELFGKFDVITMWHSLEHISEPAQVLAGIRKLLKSDGLLFISIPNVESLQARFFGPKWFHLDPTRHLVHYDRLSLRNVLAKSGFVIQSQKTLSLEYNVFGWWQSLYNLLPLEFNMAYKKLKRTKLFKPTLANRLAWFFYLGASLVTLPLAGLMTLIESILGRGGVLNVKAKKS